MRQQIQQMKPLMKQKMVRAMELQTQQKMVPMVQ